MTGVRISTATSPPLLTSLDLEELIFGNVAQGNSTALIRRGFYQIPSGTNLWNVSGSGFSEPATHAGYVWRLGSANAGGASVYSIAALDHPMGQDLTTDPAGFVRPTRYTLQCVMHRLFLNVNMPCVFGIGAINAALAFTTEEGFEVSSQIEVNAGRWTVRRRVVSAGAIVDVDTGIPGLTDVYVEIIYDNTTNPSIVARVNGQEFGGVTGLANIPARPDRVGNQTAWQIHNIYGSTSGGGGGNGFFRGFRAIIEELPGFV